jgi:anti-sigma factor (TIGR02949 family)
MPDEIRRIDCRTAVRQLWDYLDGELSDERVREVQQHLETCSECFRHAEFGRRLLDALQEVKRLHVMPPATRTQVMQALATAGFTYS